MGQVLKTILLLLSFFVVYPTVTLAQSQTHLKPQVLVSTDIGGTDLDDNQLTPSTHFKCINIATNKLIPEKL